jgi:hypothetical protein
MKEKRKLRKCMCRLLPTSKGQLESQRASLASIAPLYVNINCLGKKSNPPKEYTSVKKKIK